MHWHDWFYDGWSHLWFFPFFPIGFMVLGIIIMTFVMVPMMRRHGHDRFDFPQRTALEILNERYAKGEIDKAEYDEKRRVIS